MKKSLLALAILGAFAGAAQAQSAVTIYGSIDAGVRRLSDTNAAGDSLMTMGSSGTYSSNRIGFRGVEDLGGGLKAQFVLETGFNSGSGALVGDLFGRAANVGLAGNWGKLTFGRQYSVSFQTMSAYEPFNWKYPVIIPIAVQAAAGGSSAAAGFFGGTRFSNDIQYSNTFGGLTVRAEYALGEVAGSNRDGSAQAIGGTYAAGPFAVGAAFTQKKPLVAGAYRDHDQWTVGGAYKMGPARIAVGYANDEQEAATGRDTENRHAWVGGSYALTPAMEITAAFYQSKREQAATATDSGNGKRNLFIVGGTYALSKRTNFYAEIDRSKYSGIGQAAFAPGANSGAPAGGDTQTGISFGIHHLF